MARLFGLEALVSVFILFWIWAVIDVIATDASLCRNLPKVAWVVLVIFLFDIGALVWLLVGRPEGAGFAPGSAQSGRRQAGSRGSSPRRVDDGAQYLDDYPVSDRRSEELDRKLDSMLQQLGSQPPTADASSRDLNAWEADLNAREAELRRKELEAREDELKRREGED